MHTSQVQDNRLLVHTWSLAVEIQFYAIAPFLFFSDRRSFIVLFTIGTVSFFAYIFADAETAFYLPVCRIWEFMAGSIALVTSNRPLQGTNYTASNMGVARSCSYSREGQLYAWSPRTNFSSSINFARWTQEKASATLLRA